MKLIGVITSNLVSTEGNKINVVYKEVSDTIINNGGVPIGIILNGNYKELVDLCSGIVFQGGDDFGEYDLKVLKYIYDKNIPTLGICLGMQLMGTLFDGEMIKINNHKNNLKYSHQVKIDKNTKLYSIFGKEIINVNSRHKHSIKNTDLSISAISNDNNIEAVEDKNKTFFIGVQWHPESMLEYDSLQNNIFKEFMNSCKNKYI